MFRECFQWRMLILLISTCCLTIIVSNIVTLNFTIICMVDERYMSERENDNHTNNTSADEYYSAEELRVEPGLRGKFKWSRHVQNTLLSAFAWGALLGTLPLSWSLQRFGTRKVFCVVGIISATTTLLSPVAANHSYALLIICRVILGLSYTALFPAIGAITAHWAQLSENGLFMGMLGSATQLSPVVAMPISGALCASKHGWPAVFYVHGIVTIFLFTVWTLVYRDYPRDHPFISRREMEKIEAGKVSLRRSPDGHGKDDTVRIPWKQIFRSAPVLAIMITSFGNMTGINTVLIYCSIYLKYVLDFDIKAVSFLAALPTLFQFVLKFLGGYVSDVLPLSDNFKVKFFNCLALLGMAGFLVILAFIPRGCPVAALSMLICATAILGFHSGGFFKSATLVARHYSPLIMGVVQLIDCFTWLVIPFVVGGITVKGTVEEWQIVWLGTAAILFLTNLAFVFLGSGNPAPWAVARHVMIVDNNCKEVEANCESGKRLLRKDTALLDFENLEGFRERASSVLSAREKISTPMMSRRQYALQNKAASAHDLLT